MGFNSGFKGLNYAKTKQHDARTVKLTSLKTIFIILSACLRDMTPVHSQLHDNKHDCCSGTIFVFQPVPQ